MSGPDEQQGRESGSAPYAGAFGQIVEGLKGQPPLLVALGGGVLIVGLAGVVGGAAADLAWLLVAAIVLLVLAGLGAWLATTRARRSPDRTRHSPNIKLGDLRAGDDASVGSGRGGEMPQDISPNIRAGDTELTGRASVGSWDASGSDRPRDARRRRRTR